MNDVYQQFNVPTVINAVGYATRVAGSCPAEPVVEAMASASRHYVEIDTLETAASRLIAQHTGAEAGIVTCGAAAGLTLAAAACMCGNDPDRMDQVPDTTGFDRTQVIYPESGTYEYDHAIRASGATLVTLDYGADDALVRIKSAIGPGTAAVGFAWLTTHERPPIDQLACVAHDACLPLIVDGAMSIPPLQNMRRFIDAGADLVTFSGGKHLGGPQASGILCGRKALVRSAWLQMVDMDVRPETWSLKHLLDEGWIERPPRHGIGRSMKVGKESIVGLMTALNLYVERDHRAELQQWRKHIDTLHAVLRGIDQLSPRRHFPAPNGQPYPCLQLHTNPALSRRLRDRGILLCESGDDPSTAFIYPMCLRDDDVPTIIRVLREETMPS